MVNVDYFVDRIGSVYQPGITLLGERSLGCEARIEPTGRISAAKEFIKNSAVGVGLAQGMEYLCNQFL